MSSGKEVGTEGVGYVLNQPHRSVVLGSWPKFIDGCYARPSKGGTTHLTLKLLACSFELTRIGRLD